MPQNFEILKEIGVTSLANHMSWIQRGLPGGHKTLLSVFENKALKADYETALASINASDTLVVYATILLNEFISLALGSRRDG